MIILSRPSPSIKTLFGRKRSDLSNKLENRFYFELGRQALIFAVLSLGLKKGDTIVVPAYICDSTIQPLKNYGILVYFLDVENDLSFSEGKINKLIIERDIKAILLVHFFGFIQEFEKLYNVCSKYGVKVIEDSSHGFLSDFFSDDLKTVGDAVIYSMRKTLPVKDGGLVKFNFELEKHSISKSNSARACSSYIDDIKYLTIRLAEIVISNLGVNIYGNLFTESKNFVRRSNRLSKTSIGYLPCYPSYQLGKYLTNEEYLKSVQNRIRGNYKELEFFLKKAGFRLLFKNLGANTPQCIAIIDKRGGLLDYLRSCGVGAWQWPGEELPKAVAQNYSRYPNTIFFDKKIVLIPVHQTLSSKKINHIIKILSTRKL